MNHAKMPTARSSAHPSSVRARHSRQPKPRTFLILSSIRPLAFNTQYNRALKTSPYNMFYGQHPPSILKNAVAYPTTGPKTEEDRQLLAAEFSVLFEKAAEAAFSERARTHARQTQHISLKPMDYVTLWVAHERPDKLKPFVDIRRIREQVSDSVYVVEQIDCDLKNGTDKNQEPIVVHIDRLKKIPKPIFTRNQQKALTIGQIKDGRGIIETIRGHRHIEGKFHLIVKWHGIEDADAIAHKLPTDIEPKLLYKNKPAQDYLALHGFKYGSNGCILYPRNPSAPATQPDPPAVTVVDKKPTPARAARKKPSKK